MPSETKKILILSDGKPGHVKQSQSLSAQIRAIQAQNESSGNDFSEQTILVLFQSELHRALFPWACFILMPLVQKKRPLLRVFLKPETARAIEEAAADFVISAGSSLAPINLCLAKDLGAKSIVLMRPSFPFGLFHYDLAVVPAHDRGGIPQGAFRTRVTPSTVDAGALERDGEKLRKQLRAPEKIKVAIFLGGDTRQFKIKREDVRAFFQALNGVSLAGDYLVTTSRRTSADVIDYLEKEIKPNPACQLLVDANRDTRPEVLGGMMALAEILIVTEDSISMISEALCSGKKVMVLCFEEKKLSPKHRRFRDALAQESVIVTASVHDLAKKFLRLKENPASPVLQAEAEALKKRLQELL